MREGKVIEVDFGRKEPDTLAPLERAHVKGWVRATFWGLRLYIVLMIILVIVGFTRGSI